MDGYVRIIGTLRQFQDKVEISGYHCDPISSFNEITIHYLSCIQSYLYFKKRSNPAINSTSSAMNTSDSDDLETKVGRLFVVWLCSDFEIHSNEPTAERIVDIPIWFDAAVRIAGIRPERCGVSALHVGSTVDLLWKRWRRKWRCTCLSLIHILVICVFVWKRRLRRRGICQVMMPTGRRSLNWRTTCYFLLFSHPHSIQL